MPRYFFNIHYGDTLLDDHGTMLPNLSDARTRAMQTCSEMLLDGRGTSLWDGTAWSLWVTDDAGKILFSLNLSGSAARVGELPQAKL